MIPDAVQRKLIKESDVQKVRTISSGRQVPELTDTKSLSLDTHCPEKWIAVDLQTGEAWAGGVDGWKRATTDQRKETCACLAAN